MKVSYTLFAFVGSYFQTRLARLPRVCFALFYTKGNKSVANLLKTFFLTLIIGLAPLSMSAQSWTQLGLDMVGEANGDQSGFSVSFSADGTTVAIGAPYNDAGGSDRGHVRVYKKLISTWTQVGGDIDGEANDDWSGYSVSLSSDGTTVAIGAPYNDGGGTSSGHVRVYKNIGSVWTQVGSDINGEASNDESGWSVSLSSDGTIVAIGARYNDGGGTDRGHVRVYKNIGSVWTQVGSDINGEANDDYSGWSVSLSSDGATVAISAYRNAGGGTNRGHVRVYKNISSTWTQVGGDIDGEANDDYSGRLISLSSDGTTVAIGSNWNAGGGYNRGHVRVYKNISSSWTQVGGDIDGEANGDHSGFSVSLSSDGTTVAIGAPYNGGGGGYSRGHVRVYKYNSSTWIQQGPDIDGDADDDQSGYSVSLSPDGMTVAIGANYNAGGGYNRGHVRVYSFVASGTMDYYTDSDGDGYGAGAATSSSTPIAGKVTNNTDCNDANAAIKPGATEVCNSTDDNCNGSTDEGLTFLNYYADTDGDSYGAGAATSSCAAIAGKVTNNTDCNDANAAIKPGATEVCNSTDDNCNGSTDEGLTFLNYYADTDGDSYGAGAATSSCAAIAGKVTNNTDCNDANAAIKPGATEVCNSIDDNCDGTVDNVIIGTCPIPAGTATSAITSNSITYSWSAASCANSYRTCIRKASNLIWTYNDITTLSHNFTGLTPATEYRFRVRSKCSATMLGSLSIERKATTLAALVQNADNSVAELQQTRSDVTETRVAVFPNPSADVFNLDVQTAAKGDVAASITDLSGRVVAQWQADLTDGHTARQINLGQLPTGIYYLRLTFPDGSVEMRSLIKN